MPYNAGVLSFEEFALVMPRKVLNNITLSLILSFHFTVNNKLLITLVRVEPIKTTFAYNLNKIKNLFAHVHPEKFQRWKRNVKMR